MLIPLKGGSSLGNSSGKTSTYYLSKVVILGCKGSLLSCTSLLNNSKAHPTQQGYIGFVLSKGIVLWGGKGIRSFDKRFLASLTINHVMQTIFIKHPKNYTSIAEVGDRTTRTREARQRT